MALADIAPEVAEIKVGETSFTVQGLSVQTLADLLKEHRKEIVTLFEGKTEVTALLQESPAFIAKVIATAANEPKEVANVSRIPLGIQAKAVRKIWDLTVVDPTEMQEMFRDLIAGLDKVGIETKTVVEKVKRPDL